MEDSIKQKQAVQTSKLDAHLHIFLIYSILQHALIRKKQDNRLLHTGQYWQVIHFIHCIAVLVGNTFYTLYCKQTYSYIVTSITSYSTNSKSSACLPKFTSLAHFNSLHILGVYYCESGIYSIIVLWASYIRRSFVFFDCVVTTLHIQL